MCEVFSQFSGDLQKDTAVATLEKDLEYAFALVGIIFD